MENVSVSGDDRRFACTFAAPTAATSVSAAGPRAGVSEADVRPAGEYFFIFFSHCLVHSLLQQPSWILCCCVSTLRKHHIMQFAESLILDLADAFIGTRQDLSDLIERTDRFTVQSETEFQDHFFPFGQGVEQF